MTAKPEKKRNIWRGHALYFPLAAVLVAAIIVAVLVLISSCEAVKCESALTAVSYILAACLIFCVCAIYTAHCFQFGGSEEERQKIINSALSFVALFLVIVGAVDAYTTNYYIGGDQLALEAWVGGILAMWGLLLLGQRTKNQSKQLKIQTQELENQNKQIKIQTDKEIDDRFIAAVELLGNSESSARTGAAYSLYQLAIQSEKYRKQIAQILCSHIRSKTQEESYQKDHEKRPSNEIQTAIDILFKDVNGVMGLYCQNFAKKKDFPTPNLSHAYLCGANFKRAECHGADFSFAKCHNAKFNDAQCQKAVFRVAECHSAYFMEAECEEADFCFAECYGAHFFQSSCEGASFRSAQCQGAYFESAYLLDADFRSAQCQGARFFAIIDTEEIKFNNANFHGAHSNPMHKLEDRIGRKTEVNLLSGGEFPLKHAKVGVLEDSEKIRKIIEIIKKWETL